MLTDGMAFIAHVGDSRAISSSENGKNVFPLTVDHKPSNKEERERILAAGGEVYQSTSVSQIDP